MRGFPALAFDDYHRRVLPARCRSGAGRAAARDVRGARPIAFLLTDGRAYRLTPGANAIAVEPGAEAPTVDVLHAAPPPTGSGAGRRALYVTFMPERAFDAIPPGRGYNDVIRARESLAR